MNVERVSMKVHTFSVNTVICPETPTPITDERKELSADRFLFNALSGGDNHSELHWGAPHSISPPMQVAVRLNSDFGLDGVSRKRWCVDAGL